ncbi:unnamed protein product [Colletotrichum noveboracense]|uniref:Uncharacterized protein n=1 Tax=Colletotrichum noveboracense TaxID=2664923 RepID=A0A9W4WEK7_9PEZI|nr:unnamed protein product [Colletotrichum noveboracense]
MLPVCGVMETCESEWFYRFMYEPGQPQAEGMFEGIFDHRSEDEAVDMLSDDDSEVLELDLDDHEKE